MLHLREAKENPPESVHGSSDLFDSSRRRFAGALIESLQQRFTDNPGLIAAFGVFNLSQLPSTEDEMQGKWIYLYAIQSDLFPF